VRSGVGLLEIANFAKYEVSGPGAAGFLDGILANHLPKVGRLALTPILTPAGKLAADLTVGRLDDPCRPSRCDCSCSTSPPTA